VSSIFCLLVHLRIPVWVEYYDCVCNL
jgi:hypothetical protein